MNVVDPVVQRVENASLPFERARAMPPSVYTSEAFLECELSDIFAKDWVCVGRADALAKAGDYITCELAGQPIFVICGKDGALRLKCGYRTASLKTDAELGLP